MAPTGVALLQLVVTLNPGNRIEVCRRPGAGCCQRHRHRGTLADDQRRAGSCIDAQLLRAMAWAESAAGCALAAVTPAYTSPRPAA